MSPEEINALKKAIETDAEGNRWEDKWADLENKYKKVDVKPRPLAKGKFNLFAPSAYGISYGCTGIDLSVKVVSLSFTGALLDFSLLFGASTVNGSRFHTANEKCRLTKTKVAVNNLSADVLDECMGVVKGNAEVIDSSKVGLDNNV